MTSRRAISSATQRFSGVRSARNHGVPLWHPGIGGSTDSGKVRSVNDGPRRARHAERLAEREHFADGDELVFCGEAGGFLDASAPRRPTRRAKRALAWSPKRSGATPAPLCCTATHQWWDELGASGRRFKSARRDQAQGPQSRALCFLEISILGADDVLSASMPTPRHDTAPGSRLIARCLGVCSSLASCVQAASAS